MLTSRQFSDVTSNFAHTRKFAIFYSPSRGSKQYYNDNDDNDNMKNSIEIQQESPAVADKPARRLRKVRTVYVRAVGL